MAKSFKKYAKFKLFYKKISSIITIIVFTRNFMDLNRTKAKRYLFSNNTFIKLNLVLCSTKCKN